MVEILQLYHLSHMPILWGLENGRQQAKVVFPISDGYNVTSAYDKANLINVVY